MGGLELANVALTRHRKETGRTLVAISPRFRNSKRRRQTLFRFAWLPQAASWKKGLTLVTPMPALDLPCQTKRKSHTCLHASSTAGAGARCGASVPAISLRSLDVPAVGIQTLISKQQSRSLAGRVGMVEHNPRMVVLRYVGSLPTARFRRPTLFLSRAAR